MGKYLAGFIGAGNMGGIIASAVSKRVGKDAVAVCCSSEQSSKEAALRIGCDAASFEEICDSRYIFLGIKPQMAQSVLPKVAECIKDRKDDYIIVSMLAGTTVDTLCELCKTQKIVRIMPNTPSAVGEGVTLVCASSFVPCDEVKAFCDLILFTGKTDVLPEKLFDAATALSGCGPAYVYMFLEALADGAVKCGLPRTLANEYAARTVLGASKLALLSDEHTGKLKDAVCSPGGSTIEGVSVLEKEGFRASVIDAVNAAFEKSKALGKK